MLSSTKKMHRAPRARASTISASVALSLSPLCEHAADWEAVKVAAAHLDDRAKAAVVRTAARRLHHVDRSAEQRVTREHAGAAVRQPDHVGIERADWARRRVDEARPIAVCQTRDVAVSGASIGVNRPQDLPERHVALAAHDNVDPERGVGVRLWCEAGVVAADHDAGFGT